jgi:hypothetical protein
VPSFQGYRLLYLAMLYAAKGFQNWRRSFSALPTRPLLDGSCVAPPVNACNGNVSPTLFRETLSMHPDVRTVDCRLSKCSLFRREMPHWCRWMSRPSGRDRILCLHIRSGASRAADTCGAMEGWRSRDASVRLDVFLNVAFEGRSCSESLGHMRGGRS